MDSANDEEKRIEFEKFIIERFGDAVDLRREKNGDDGYISWEAAVAWTVWLEHPSHHKTISTGIEPA
ncbi:MULTISPECIES: hypothetical protein [unclassified Citrobacter]|uniref:hypothetical protein n=1 Tax=unclassified Citrobacter TaxID=2644389 RepID=UPI00129BAAA9|nr:MULTISPECIES: hypothetical protein [unclassified Citrobacter]